MATLQARPKRRRSQNLEATQARTAWWLVLPSLIVVALVAGYPLFRTIALSFTDSSFFNPGQEHNVGLANYTRLFADPIWWASVKNTVVFTVFSVAIEFFMGLFVAMVINSNFRGRGVVRTAMLVPWAIPTVISAQMWKWMYNDVIGVINDLLIRAHIISQSIGWLANPSTTMPSIIAVDIWKTTPFVALLLLAGLQAIPSDIYEAARVDGANAFVQFWRLTLPLLRPAILVTLIFRTLDALRVFDVIYVMTGTTQSTISMAVYDRQQLIDFGGLGFGSAASVIIFLIISVFTVGYVTSLKVRFD